MQNDPLAKIKLIFFDFDGVFTDNRVIIDEDGKEAVICNRSDGIGLSLVRKLGIQSIVISAEINPIVSVRCQKLGIDCVQACSDKKEEIKKIIQKKKLNLDQVMYVGNDIPDIKSMEYVGFPVAVANAYPQVKTVARMITSKKGGKGAVREICEWILNARRKQL